MKKSVAILFAAAVLGCLMVYIGCTDLEPKQATAPQNRCAPPQTDFAPGRENPMIEDKHNTLDTPTIECYAPTLSTISLQVTAGASGAPEGFTVQWMPLPTGTVCGDFVWPAPHDTAAVSICEASLSVTHRCSAYDLPPFGRAAVTIGHLNSAPCEVRTNRCGANELLRGTTYVFRAFANRASHGLGESPFTSNLCCRTERCLIEPVGICCTNPGCVIATACECGYLGGTWMDSGTCDMCK